MLRYGVYRSTLYVLFVFLRKRVVTVLGRGFILACGENITRTKRKLLELMRQILAVHMYRLCGPFLFKTLHFDLVGSCGFPYTMGPLKVN